jgi:hypothetical protein
MTLSIVDFLKERIEEDRKLAQAAIDDLNGPDDCYFDTSNRHIVNHYLRHDPARVLREVTAKRAVMERHCPSQAGGCAGCGVYLGRDDQWQPNVQFEDCEELLGLAAIYNDHQDFREEWGA